jgi:ABC-type lipoprotein release transport system permease subunit
MVRNCVAKDAVVTTKFSVRFSFVLLCGELVLVVMYCVMNGFKKKPALAQEQVVSGSILIQLSPTGAGERYTGPGIQKDECLCGSRRARAAISRAKQERKQ